MGSLSSLCTVWENNISGRWTKYFELMLLYMFPGMFSCSLQTTSCSILTTVDLFTAVATFPSRTYEGYNPSPEGTSPCCCGAEVLLGGPLSSNCLVSSCDSGIHYERRPLKMLHRAVQWALATSSTAEVLAGAVCQPDTSLSEEGSFGP